MFRDQAGIWTAPARLRGRKWLWLAPFAAATTLAFVYDVRAMNALGPSTTRVRVSNDFTHLGAGYTLVGAAGLTYLIGKLDHGEGAREAGMLALEGIADASLVVEALKLATNRQRPYVPPGTGKFWPDDTDIYTFSSSFPSGHAAATWAFARVMVEETPGHPWLHVALYGLATGVAIASAIALADTFTTIIPPSTNRRQNRCASNRFIIQPPHLTAYLSLSILKTPFGM